MVPCLERDRINAINAMQVTVAHMQGGMKETTARSPEDGLTEKVGLKKERAYS